MLYLPVPDLAKALAFYRDGLGWAEVWREGRPPRVSSSRAAKPW